MRFLSCILLSFCFLLSACNKEPSVSVAIVDINKVLTSSPHAKQADAEATQAQEIYQYNLNVIKDKLATYTNKQQAEAWLLEARNQLQAQLTTSRAALAQAMGETLRKEIIGMSAEYELVLPKGGVLASNETLDISTSVQLRYDKATVAWPALPNRIDNPNLPADTKDDLPEKEAATKK